MSENPKIWRSLDELANSAEYRKHVDDEFPNRRDILRMMGATLSFAAFTGCVKQPQERIFPYVRQPEEITLGRPLYFATTMPFRGQGFGLLVESHEGRPTKIEGNPLHPASLGRTLPFHQAATLDLYNPERSQAVYLRDRISSWGNFLNATAEIRQTAGAGEGLYILTEVSTSPTLLAMRDQLQKRYPGMRWHQYDPVTLDTAPTENTVYGIDRAAVILSLDADFLYGPVPYSRAFIARRRQRQVRLYVAEPTPSITGDLADHRLRMKASQIENYARTLLGQITGSPTDPVARDLVANKGAALVIAGEQQPPAVHAIARAMNQALGAPVTYTDPLMPAMPGLGALANDMRGGRVKSLFIAGCNPIYDAPADLDFPKLLNAVPMRAHLGLFRDETARNCHWHIPQAHFLETWGDAVAFDGTVSLIQPLIAPLYGGKSILEFLSTLTDNPDQSAHRLVMSFWEGDTNPDRWQQWLHDGVVPNTALPARPAQPPAAGEAAQQLATTADGLELVFRPDPCIWDGRFFHNTWLQELPKPHTKLTWDNALYVSPATAQRLGLNTEDLVEIRYRGRMIQGPVMITPGQADDVVTAFLGYGRDGRGYNANALRSYERPHFDGGVELRKTGRRYQLATTQNHHSMEGRDIVRIAHTNETDKRGEREQGLTLYPEWEYKGYRWGMSIDLTACIGCNACVMACTAENNVPVVGKDQVLRAREMHWLRIDRYFDGTPDDPRTHFQPMLCQHCEKAPCEPVCPVAATVHSADGLNQMIYNRCVGTRYCSNNCPYKVRRFNFLLYQDWDTPVLQPLRNPDVSVRSRGVMEKCTYCIQRIQEARIETEKEGRRIRDGEVVTACQQACPTDAIIFGDLNDPESRAAKLRHDPLTYSVLHELGTQPRTTYLAKIQNLNPDVGANRGRA